MLSPCRALVGQLLLASKIAAVRILDPNSPLAERLGEEIIAMRFAWWLVDQVGISVNSSLPLNTYPQCKVGTHAGTASNSEAAWTSNGSRSCSLA